MNKLTRFFFALWLVIAGSFGSPQPCLADIVTLRGESEVHRMAVRLSDVFIGVPASVDADIAQAPAPGKQAVYDINVLTRLVNKYHLDWKPQSLADHAVITTACTHISIDAIRNALTEKLKSDSSATVQKFTEVEVNLDNHMLQVDVPTDQASDFTVNNVDYDPTTKRFHADVVAQTAGGPFTTPITGHMILKRSVPVLAKRLDAGVTISNSDIDWMPVATDRINSSVVTEASQLVGRELRHETSEGELLHAHDIIPPRLVTRGAMVTMKIETAAMQVLTQGKALQDGTQGDIVRVMNTQSNRMIEGTVTGPGMVLIQTTQRLAEAQ